MRTHLLLSLITITILTAFGYAEPAESTSKPSILITGANRGLGLELCKQYLKQGYIVYGTARKPEKATELQATDTIILPLDVTSQESIDALAQQLRGKPLDILINNAGYFGPNPIGTRMDAIWTLSREEIENCHAVNTMGPLFVTKALIPNVQLGKMKKIINMSTCSSMLSRKGGGAMGYRISKAGLNMVTVVLSAQLKQLDIIVISAAPGHNKTDMGTDMGNLLPSQSMPQLMKVIDELTMEQTGGFWYYNGKNLPW